MTTQPGEQPRDTNDPEEESGVNEDLHGTAADVQREMASDDKDGQGPTPGGG